MEQLTACKNCEHIRLGYRSYIGVFMSDKCKANPIEEWSAYHGHEIATDYKDCNIINTDGHCEQFKKAHEKPIEESIKLKWYQKLFKRQ